MNTFRAALALLVLWMCVPPMAHAQSGPASRARNVILLFGDGMGLSSLNAASILAHGQPQALYLQRMPHFALADTSSSAQWVTDAGAAATAMATGRKTANRMVSYLPPEGPSIDGKRPPETILEYAEEQGLSTGVISDSAIINPLVSAFYAHHEDRNKSGEIFSQLLTPRFGDGVDIVIGPGRKAVMDAMGARAEKLSSEFGAKGYVFSNSLHDLDSSKNHRLVVAFDDAAFDLAATVDKTAARLAANPKGFFLAVHSDCHLREAEKSLRCVVALDKIVQALSERYGRDTLILVSADHAYGLHTRGQQVAKTANFISQVVLADEHEGEEVPVLASGPGSERVQGFVPNTKIFDWVMQAYGWRLHE